MNEPIAISRTVRTRSSGFTLVEAAVSIVLVSVLLVAALNAVGGAKLAQQKIADRGRAFLLAQELMSEIMRQDYADPEDVGSIDLSGGPVTALPLGRESGESGGFRADFDDVDDYNGWDATPPENKDGSVIPNLTGWRRIVTVDRRTRANPHANTNFEEGLKQITVQVERDGALLMRLKAMKGVGLRPLPVGPRVLLVVVDGMNPTVLELARKTLMESWSFSVTLISAVDTQANFDAAILDADVAYISETIEWSILGAKLVAATIGVVNEEGLLIADFGFASGVSFAYFTTDGAVLDNTHYISSPFAVGPILLTTSPQPLIYTNSGFGAGVQVLATISSGKPSLLAIETGGILSDGGAAPARRVKTIWGHIGFDITTLTPEAETIMKRAIEWAASMEKP